MSKSAEAFRTISEVADDLEIQKHVLRFWEVKFAQIRPMKRGGGRRYYRPEDMELLRGIRHLLHREGYTIKGVQKILREQGVDIVKGFGRAPGDVAPSIVVAPVAAAKLPAQPKQREAIGEAGRKPAPATPPATRFNPEVAPSSPAARRRVLSAAVAELEACRKLLAGGSTATTERLPRRRTSAGP